MAQHGVTFCDWCGKQTVSYAEFHLFLGGICCSPKCASKVERERLVLQMLKGLLSGLETHIKNAK